jgi:hypothetical protein
MVGNFRELCRQQCAARMDRVNLVYFVLAEFHKSVALAEATTPITPVIGMGILDKIHACRRYEFIEEIPPLGV